VQARRDRDHVVIEVLDEGPGFTDEFLPHAFERFRRADDARSSTEGGSGLGLAIVQRAVEAHRGLVLVESGSGTGTIFTIFLPAKMMAEDAA
jgi:signal transduction histidine kinase